MRLLRIRMDFHEDAVNARGHSRPRQIRHHVALAPRGRAHSARELHRVRGVEDHRKTHLPHDGQRADIENEVVVSERRSALRDQNVAVAGGLDFFDDVGDVPGRQKLAFFTFTTGALFAISTTKSVWRHKKAGTCKTSRTALAASISSKRCTSDSTGTPAFSLTLLRSAAPP